MSVQKRRVRLLRAKTVGYVNPWALRIVVSADQVLEAETANVLLTDARRNPAPTAPPASLQMATRSSANVHLENLDNFAIRVRSDEYKSSSYIGHRLFGN